jgi:hypothetical protein
MEMTMNDDDFTSPAGKDLALYVSYLASGCHACCARIERRYGLFGLSPQQVSEELAEIAAIQEERP